MTNYSITPLSTTFGYMLRMQEPDGFPDPKETMALFQRSGALLLRGFPFTIDSFVAFSDQFCSRFSKYVGGGIRFKGLNRIARDASGTVLSTTGTTQSFGIPLHGEMYYQKDRPDMLWFYCALPPEERGQTTLADGREIFARLSEPSKELLRNKRLRYIRELSSEDWHTSFMTENIEELRQFCNNNEMSLEVLPNDSVRINFLDPAIVTFNEQEAFINNAALLWDFERGLRAGYGGTIFGDELPSKLPIIVRFEDGSELPEWLMTEIEEVSDNLTIKVEWQTGDVVMVDNRVILHGRCKSASEKRDILVRLGSF